MNSSFYRFPRVEFLQKWYENSPGHFKFSVKAPRLITHYKRFNECHSLLQDFYNTIEEGLKEKLGVVLIQLPPRYEYSIEKLENILCQLNTKFSNAIEFRDKSWWKKSVYKKLKDHNVIFTGISHPSLPDEPVINGSTVYYRLHGVPKLYYSAYPESKLREIAEQIKYRKNINEV